MSDCDLMVEIINELEEYYSPIDPFPDGYKRLRNRLLIKQDQVLEFVEHKKLKLKLKVPSNEVDSRSA